MGTETSNVSQFRGKPVPSFEFQVSSLKLKISIQSYLEAHSPEFELETRNLKLFRLPVVLFQFPVERFAPNAESAGGVRFVATGVIEGRFNRLSFDLFHR